jgi:DNA-binding transcriptional ArsR family regulator
LEQSLPSHHLQALRKSGLVTSKRMGKVVRYRLSPKFALTSSGDTLDLGCCALSCDPKAPQQSASKTR